jgi:hypothetical protein
MSAGFLLGFSFNACASTRCAAEALVRSMETKMQDHRISLNQHCTCSQSYCRIRGNCVLCVQNHLEHKRHIPECIQNLLRDNLKPLADKLEYRLEDCRPDDDIMKKLAKTDFLKKSLARHKPK